MYPYPVLFGKIGLYEICLAVGIVAVFFLADRMAIKRGFSVGLQRLFVVAMPLAIFIGFGGAILFQGFYDYLETGVFKLDNTTGMTFYGGFIVGVIVFLLVWFFGAKLFKLGEESKKRFFDVTEIAACLIPLGHGFGRLGCFFVGCCHGYATDAWYGVNMWTESGWQKVLPVQLYEAVFLFILSAALFVCICKMGEGARRRIPLLAIYAVAYGVWRFLIEYLRGDNRGETIVSFLSPSQLTALILIAVGIAYFCICFFIIDKRKNTNQ